MTFAMMSIGIADYAMARTRVSAKYQIVIPKEVRERHGLQP